MMTADAHLGDLIDHNRVLELHRQGVERYGGLVGAPREGCVEGALGNAMTAEYYRESGDNDVSGLVFAACSLMYLVSSHCFGDGNKRVGWLVMTDVLAKLRLTVNATQDEAEAFVLQIARGDLKDRRKIVQWVAERLQAAPSAFDS